MSLTLQDFIPFIPYAMVAIYMVMIAVLMAGLSRVPRSRFQPGRKPLPTVSVVVSARNEEEDLPGCIDSLLALRYPEDRLQIILVNDRSDDRTAEIMQQAARRHPGLLVLHSNQMDHHGLEGKARGIACGFKKATGEWVAITDADARVHPEWLRYLLGDVPEEVGMTGGSLAVEPDGWIGYTERMTWAFVQMYNVGVAGFGRTIACVGPNMLIRREIYERAGGLEQADFKIAEDLALVEMVRSQGYHISNFMDEFTTNTLRPVDSWSHLFSQKKRWLGGGMANPGYKIPLIIGFGAAFIFSVYLLLGWLVNAVVWMTVLFLKSLADISFLTQQARRMKLKRYVSLFYMLQIFWPVVMAFLTLGFLWSRTITWKGKGYSIEYR